MELLSTFGRTGGCMLGFEGILACSVYAGSPLSENLNSNLTYDGGSLGLVYTFYGNPEPRKGKKVRLGFLVKVS